MIEHELGAVVKRYPTDNHRRRKIALVAVPVGAVAVCLAALSYYLVYVAGDAEPNGSMMVPALVCGAGLGAFGVGLRQGRLSFVRSDEAFVVHEGGLTHSYAGKSWAIRWDNIAKVKDHHRDTAVNRALGTDVNYRLKLREPVDGRRSVLLTDLTDDVVRLAEDVRYAAEYGVLPQRQFPA